MRCSRSASLKLPNPNPTPRTYTLKDMKDMKDMKDTTTDEHLESLAAQALAALAQGDWARAVMHADEARAVENAYGDCPTWGDFATAVSELSELSEPA
jgi:hypothetical protein